MAFDTAQTKLTRTVIIVVALLVVAIVAVVLVTGVVGPGMIGDAAQATSASADGAAAGSDADGAATGTDADAASDDAATSSDDAADDADAMETVDAQYGTATQQLLTQYEADPSNPSALLNLANGYFDWGVAALNHASTTEEHAHATDLLTDAVGYYDTYLDANPAAKSAIVDRAICTFYTGDTDRAIAELEDLATNLDAGFAPAWANLGMFYEAAGRTDDARNAYQTAIDAAGDGDAYNVKAYAQERLDALQ